MSTILCNRCCELDCCISQYLSANLSAYDTVDLDGLIIFGYIFSILDMNTRVAAFLFASKLLAAYQCSQLWMQEMFIAHLCIAPYFILTTKYSQA